MNKRNVFVGIVVSLVALAGVVAPVWAGGDGNEPEFSANPVIEQQMQQTPPEPPKPAPAVVAAPKAQPAPQSQGVSKPRSNKPDSLRP